MLFHSSVWPKESQNPELSKLTTRVENLMQIFATSDRNESEFMVRKKSTLSIFGLTRMKYCQVAQKRT